MEKIFTFNVDLKDIEITPELEERFQRSGKTIRSIATVGEINLGDKELSKYPKEQKVLVIANYEIGQLEVQILDEMSEQNE